MCVHYTAALETSTVHGDPSAAQAAARPRAQERPPSMRRFPPGGRDVPGAGLRVEPLPLPERPAAEISRHRQERALRSGPRPGGLWLAARLQVDGEPAGWGAFRASGVHAQTGSSLGIDSAGGELGWG